MKINFSSSTLFENRWRSGVRMLASVALICSALTQGAGQLKTEKRITSLQIAEAAEGARVTIVSDSALNDYEAFRRGDRFYVRIPLADFTAAQPQFSGDGFDDVQVQKVGDSVVVSFKLQPGATARVDQRLNRLDIIFASPGRLSGNSANAVRNRVISNSARTNPIPRVSRRDRDAAGPIPPGSPSTTSPSVEEVQSETSSDVQTLQTRRASIHTRMDSNSSTRNESADSPPPNSDSSPPVASTTTQSYSPYNTGTSAPPVSTPLVKPPGSASSWKTRGQHTVQWLSANRLATLIGAAVLLIMMVFAVFMMFWRRKKVAKAKRAKVPGVQPKYSTDFDLDDLLAAEVGASASSTASTGLPNEYLSDLGPIEPPVSAVPIIAPASASSVQDHVVRIVHSEPVVSSAAFTTSQEQAWFLNRPSSSSFDYGISESPEREVFEL
jgi:hypothetical protein